VRGGILSIGVPEEKRIIFEIIEKVSLPLTRITPSADFPGYVEIAAIVLFSINHPKKRAC
jgi:hypothetical protein